MSKVRIINGKGDWTDIPPTGADDHDLQSMADDFVMSAGVLEPERGYAIVEESDTPGMSFQVAPGVIYVPNAAWTANSTEPKYYIVTRDAIATGVISSNPSGSTRYDIVCQKIDKVTTPNDNADNVCPIVVVAGTPGGGFPAVPDNHEALAVIEVASGETSITNAEILDARSRVFTSPHLANPGFVTLVDGATVTADTDFGKYNKFFVTIAGNRTLAFANLPFGFPVLVYVQQGSGGSHTLALPTNVNDYGAGFVLSTVAGEYDAFVFVALPTGDISAVKVANSQT